MADWECHGSRKAFFHVSLVLLHFQGKRFRYLDGILVISRIVVTGSYKLDSVRVFGLYLVPSLSLRTDGFNGTLFSILSADSFSLPYLGFLLLLFPGVFLLRLSLLQYIGKQRGSQVPFVAVTVFRHPHALPLLR